nr:MAG TPA: hypothetical protein [Caudoviricetes sp.]
MVGRAERGQLSSVLLGSWPLFLFIRGEYATEL